MKQYTTQTSHPSSSRPPVATYIIVNPNGMQVITANGPIEIPFSKRRTSKDIHWIDTQSYPLYFTCDTHTQYLVHESLRYDGTLNQLPRFDWSYGLDKYFSTRFFRDAKEEFPAQPSTEVILLEKRIELEEESSALLERIA